MWLETTPWVWAWSPLVLQAELPAWCPEGVTGGTEQH